MKGQDRFAHSHSALGNRQSAIGNRRMEAIQTRYRTHTCGQLRKADVGKDVKLAGWVHSYRDHGGLVFIDLRDRDGLTQLVFDADVCGKATHDEARKLRGEWVISVTGQVHARGDGLTNPKLATGEIEIMVKSMEVLSQSPTPPFTPDEREQVWAPFRRGRGHASVAGSGIGLSIVRDVATRHGGRAWVESASTGDASPAGARFVVALPVRGECARAAGAA
jgi:hypothetical protein